jgi:hypothetical protein
VTCDVVLVLRHDGKTCGPDVAVIEGDVDTSKITGAVNLAAVGGRLAFAFEAVSTSEKEIEDKDLEKNMVRYAKEGVEEYFTVYPVVERKVRDLVGRRLEKGGYVEIAPDADGRVYSRKLDLYFQIDAASEELVVVDATTGERLLTSDEEEAGRRQEAAARRQAEERAEQEAAARRRAEVRGVEDVCTVLGLAWDAERRARVERMSPSQLEALRRHLVNERVGRSRTHNHEIRRLRRAGKPTTARRAFPRQRANAIRLLNSWRCQAPDRPSSTGQFAPPGVRS